VGNISSCLVIIYLDKITHPTSTSSGFEIANFVVGIGKLSGIIPLFGKEIVINIVGKGSGKIVAIFN
jgi:hypothetical protein